MNSAQQYPENHFSICFSTINHGASQTGRDIERLENKIKFQLLRKLREIHPHASDVGWNKDLVGQNCLGQSTEPPALHCNDITIIGCIIYHIFHISYMYDVYWKYNSSSPVSTALHCVTVESLKEGGAGGAWSTPSLLSTAGFSPDLHRLRQYQHHSPVTALSHHHHDWQVHFFNYILYYSINSIYSRI